MGDADSKRAYGRAYVIVLPAHPDDVTVRALAVLRDAAMVASTDSAAAHLLRHHDIAQIVTRPTLKTVLRRLAVGEDVALLIGGGDDPTGGLAVSIDDAGYAVSVLPAVSPLAGLLPAAGYGATRVNVLGRLPTGQKKRAAILISCTADLRPLAVSIPSGRVAETVASVAEVFGDRPAVLADGEGRITRASLAALPRELPPNIEGESLLIVAGRDPADARPDDLTAIGERARELFADGLSTTVVAKKLAAETCLTRRQAYDLARSSAGGSVVATEISFAFHGHPGIRATHAKTIEFKREADVTPRETCVIGVGADWDPAALKSVTGGVTIEIEVGDERYALTATINRRFAARDRLVVRKSRHSGEVTLATGADAAAADLPPALVRTLRDSRSVGRVTIRRRS